MAKKLSNLKPGAVISGLWKGKTGAGKTIASCGKEFRPVYVLDFDLRMDSVLYYYMQLDGHCNDIEYDEFPMGRSWKDLDKRMDSLAARCEYKSVTVASLSNYINFILKHTIQAKVGQKRQSGESAGKFVAGIPVTEVEDYLAEDAALIFELMQFFQQLKANGVNVFLEAHITPLEIKPKKGDPFTSLQILTKGKKAPAQIPSNFNEVYLFEKEYDGIVVGQGTTKYTVQSETDDCKTSMGIRGFEWTDLDFSVELMSRISSEMKSNPRVDPDRPKTVEF